MTKAGEWRAGRRKWCARQAGAEARPAIAVLILFFLMTGAGEYAVNAERTTLRILTLGGYASAEVQREFQQIIYSLAYNAVAIKTPPTSWQVLETRGRNAFNPLWREVLEERREHGRVQVG